MKGIIPLCMIVCIEITGSAQSDTTIRQADTIKVGGMIIIRKAGGEREIIRHRKNGNDTDITLPRRKYDKPSNVSTNWWILDLGFSNYNDKTNYATAVSSGFVGSTVNAEALKAKSWKSRNVDLWFFMQRLNLVKHFINLKYGVGLEMNNYHFDDNRVHLLKNPTKIILDSSYSTLNKNKLA